MADKKTTETKAEEKEFVIPLRKEWQKVANYRRAGRAAKAIKKFIAKHMKVPDRDVDKVKLDIYLNQEIWFRGKRKPPAKIKVKAERDGDLIRVSLAEIPEHVKFLKRKQEKQHAPSSKPKAPPKAEEKPAEEKTEEEKKEEKEKAASAAEQKASVAEAQAKVQKHLTKVKEPGHHRLALKK